MPEKIGKYQVIERIGRGGMGMIFKAYDRVLDRAVALKLISTDVEVTDELRARFFREAQACARLSHPNIVTVYDMGEHDGRLYIVMELLEGEELRHLIAQRKPLALEEKISVMLQVCEGLHYAHEQGIVHRDIKPANIFLLRNGQVKILDFGIAQVATTEGGLTRSGLIMGTLRYISPEQVRGQASSRSDMFSVGAVFYELLSLQAPFTGTDPMNLLEQLRSADPLPLQQLDPAIPTELAHVVERALRKDPAQRFADLEQMRRSIEVVQRNFREEAERVRDHLRAQVSEILQLQQALTERIGALPEAPALPTIEKVGRVAAMRAIEEDLSSRIETLRQKIAKADALAPGRTRGLELLQAQRFADAVVELEAIVAEMPEHARAHEELREARAQAEEHRRHQLTVQLLRDAQAAFDGGRYALCLQILKRAADAPPTATAAEIASLRQRAEARLAVEDAARRERERAERAREQMEQARRASQAEEVARYASALWSDAEVKAAEAHAHLAQESYPRAGQAFEEAEAFYRRALEASGEARARARESAERGRGQMETARQEAEAAKAPEFARDLWEAAEAKDAEGRAALGRQPLGYVGRLFDDAALLYGQAGDAARAAWERLRQGAEQARARAIRARDTAAGTGAERDAVARWAEAIAKLAEADASLQREGFASASREFGEAGLLFRQAESEAAEVVQSRRLQSERARDAMEEARDRALAGTASTRAHELWADAEHVRAAGEMAFASEHYAEATEHFGRALMRYAESSAGAREAARWRDFELTAAESEREALVMARQVGFEARAPHYAARDWSLAEDARQRAEAAASRQDHAAARALSAEARGLYAAAAEAARLAIQAEARRIDTMINDARRFLESGDAAASLVRLNEVFALRPGHPPAESLRLEAETALRRPRPADSLPRPEMAPARLIDSASARDNTELRSVAPTAKLETSAGHVQPSLQASADLTLPSAPSAHANPERRGADGQAGEDAAAAHAHTETSRNRTADLAAAETRDDGTIVALPRGLTMPPGSARIALPEVDASDRDRSTRLRTRAVVIGAGALALAAVAFFLWRPLGPASPPVVTATAPTPPSAPPSPAPAADIPSALAKQDEPAPTGQTDAGTRAEAGATPAKDEADVDANVAAAARRLLDKRDRHDSESPRTAMPSGRSAADTNQDTGTGRATTATPRPRQAQSPPAMPSRPPSPEPPKLPEPARMPPPKPTQSLPAQRQVAALRVDTEQAQSRMAVARRAAEQAGAGFYAPKLFASAKAKERDGVAAADQSDFARATRLFADAQSDYQTAALDSKREADSEWQRALTLKANAERSHARATGRREAAIKVEADRLAKDLFERGEATQSAGDTQFGEQNFQAATQSYQEAAQRYLEATVRAQSVRDAR